MLDEDVRYGRGEPHAAKGARGSLPEGGCLLNSSIKISGAGTVLHAGISNGVTWRGVHSNGRAIVNCMSPVQGRYQMVVI